MSFGDFTLDLTLDKFINRYNKQRDNYGGGIGATVRAYVIALFFRRRVDAFLKTLKNSLLETLTEEVDLTVRNERYIVSIGHTAAGAAVVEVNRIED